MVAASSEGVVTATVDAGVKVASVRAADAVVVDGLDDVRGNDKSTDDGLTRAGGMREEGDGSSDWATGLNEMEPRAPLAHAMRCA